MAPIRSSNAIVVLEGLLGYQFEDKSWLMEALYAGGPTTIGGRAITDANKRLAQVGDTALRLVLHDEGFDAGASKGTTDDRVQKIACNANLDQAGREQGLEKYIILNPGTTVVSARTMATTVEAILGALLKDSGGDLAALKRAKAVFGLV